MASLGDFSPIAQFQLMARGYIIKSVNHYKDSALSFLVHLTTEASRLCLTRICRNTRILVQTTDALDETVAFQHSCTMQLFGSVARIILRYKFDPQSVARWVARRKDDQSDPSEKEAIDLVREFSNQLAGTLRGIFDSAGIPIGMSLPLDAKLSKASAPSDSIKDNEEEFEWLLSDGSRVLFCSAKIDLKLPDLIETARERLTSALKEESAKGARGGGFEFF